MALLKILIWPEPLLAAKAEPIAEIDSAVRRLALDMLETMYAARGIGLAANQVGVTKRLIVIDLNPLPGEEEEGEERSDDAGPHILINPEISEREGSIIWEEGCLSVPGEIGEVERAQTITVHFTNLDGKPVTATANDLLAVCIQHEIDHLDGVVFPQRMHDRERARAIRLAMKKIKSEGKT
jgi:peptide deformylase